MPSRMLPASQPAAFLPASSSALFRLQADHLLSLYYGEWNKSVDPIYSPQFTY